MSGFNPGRRPGRRTILSDILIVVLALVIVVMSVLIFFLREEYNGLIPAVFILGAVMNGFHALHCFSRDENRKRNYVGTVFSAVFGIALTVLAVISGVAIWGGR